MSYENDIREIVRKTLCLKNSHIIADNDNLEKLGMDSIKFVRLIVELEEKFVIKVPDNMLNIRHVRTINSIKKFLSKINSR